MPLSRRMTSVCREWLACSVSVRPTHLLWPQGGAAVVVAECLGLLLPFVNQNLMRLPVLAGTFFRLLTQARLGPRAAHAAGQALATMPAQLGALPPPARHVIAASIDFAVRHHVSEYARQGLARAAPAMMLEGLEAMAVLAEFEFSVDLADPPASPTARGPFAVSGWQAGWLWRLIEP